MQSAGGILVSDEGEKRGVLRIGPFWPEHPRTITAFFLPAYYALLLGFRAQHLVQLTTRVTMFEWLQTREWRHRPSG
jgi:hypothetical protein